MLYNYYYSSGLKKTIRQASDISGLVLWLDASDTSTITESGDVVSAWADKSGSGFNASVLTGASGPLTNTDTINGLNVLTFEGNLAEQGLMIEGITIIPNTVVAVFKGSATPWADWDGVITARSSSSTKLSNSTNPSGFQGLDNSSNMNGVGQSSVSVYVDGVEATAASFDSFLVGVSASPITDPHVLLYTDNLGSGTQNYGIGVDIFGALGTRHLNGLIGEIIIYNRALSVTEILDLSRALKIKWGIA